MADDQEENSSPETPKEPTPLALEGSTTQLELGIKPPPAPKTTNVAWKKKDFIKEIISTPKESGSSDSSEPSSSTSSSGSKPPKEPIQDIISRLDDGGDKGSSSSGTPASPEENKDTADMFIDGFNALFIFFIGIWSKDPDMVDYEVETEEKTKLKKYLAKILTRAENKINPIWIFIGLMAVTYIPMLRKAHRHKKMVEEQRVKDDPNTIILEDKPQRKRRSKRGRGGDSDAEFYNAEEIK